MDTGCIPPTVNFFQYTSYISAYAEISPPSWCDKNADAELLGSGVFLYLDAVGIFGRLYERSL